MHLTIPPLARAVGTLLLLFALSYLPAFVVVGYLKPSLSLAVPLIIAISLAAAMGLIAMLARRPAGFSEFGFRFCRLRYLAAAVVVAVPVGWALCTLVARLSSGPPMPEMALPLWMQVLYLIVGAAIQEEIIFRGLLQSTFARQFPATLAIFGVPVAPSVFAAGILFGVIHLEINAPTAAAAFALGVLAGELRRRSGSLLPAMIVHAIFNGLSAIIT